MTKSPSHCSCKLSPPVQVKVDELSEEYDEDEEDEPVMSWRIPADPGWLKRVITNATKVSLVKVARACSCKFPSTLEKDELTSMLLAVHDKSTLIQMVKKYVLGQG